MLLPLQGTCNDPDNYDEDRDDYPMDTIQAMAQNADSVRDRRHRESLVFDPFWSARAWTGVPHWQLTGGGRVLLHRRDSGLQHPPPYSILD